MAVKTILCVDSEPTLLATRELVLESAGYVVVTSDPRNALTLFVAHRVDAVVLHVGSTETEVASLAARLKRTNPIVPILLLTAFNFVSESLQLHIDASVCSGDGPVAMLYALKALLNDNAEGRGAA
jgi:DNA-binding response OmpR family regulator